MSKWLIAVGAALVAAGLLWPMLSSVGLEKLVGDIAIEREGFTFYFPLMSCLVISAIVSIIIWFFRR